MTKEEFYNISIGIYFSFKKHKNMMSKKFNHNEATRSRNLKCVSSIMYQLNKMTLVASCLLCNIKYKPKSINSMFENLSNLSENEITDFKNDIKNYQNYFNEDLAYIKENKISDINTLFNLVIKRKIKFYSLYYIIKKLNLEEKITSRIFKIIWDDIKTSMIFLNLGKITSDLSEN